MARIRGAKQIAARIRALGDQQTIKDVTKALFDAGKLVETDAAHSITQGSVSGAKHKPSTPGTPPNNDTGVLARSIQTVAVEPLQVEVFADAPYAAIQEYGGTIQHPGGTPYFMKDGKPVFVSKQGYGAFHTLPVTKAHEIVLAERPYMRPALAKNKAAVIKLVDQAMARAVKRMDKIGGD